MSGKNYDSRCYDLASVFLEGEPNFTDEKCDELAALIQRTIEDQIAYWQRNYEPPDPPGLGRRICGEPLMADDLSKELAEARREMRRRILRLDDVELKSLYYRAIMLSEHEAARLAVDKVLTRSSLSNKAEA